VSDDAVELTLPDHRGALRAVALRHELRAPRRVEFTRERPRDPWRLTFQRPDADRIEYLLELTRRAGSTEVVPDPGNPLRAAGPFGDKSVIEFPGYEEPGWVSDEDTAQGELRALPLGEHPPAHEVRRAALVGGGYRSRAPAAALGRARRP